MNFDKVGQPVAIIKNTDTNKSVAELFYEYDRDKDEHKKVTFYKEIEIDNPSEKIQPIPNKKMDRLVWYIAGMQGAGKSYFIRSLLLEYIRLYSNYPIYLFSSKNEDKNLDDIKQLKRIKLDASFCSCPMNYEALAQSIVIFDDVDALPDRKEMKLKTEIYYLRDKVINNGRSLNIECITTNHDLTGRDMRACLNGCNVLVFFLKTYNKTMRYLLEAYIGLDTDQIKIIRKNKTRATTFYKDHGLLVQEKNAYIINEMIE